VAATRQANPSSARDRPADVISLLRLGPTPMYIMYIMAPSVATRAESSDRLVRPTTIGKPPPRSRPIELGRGRLIVVAEMGVSVPCNGPSPIAVDLL
jgi:hypothetical protein